MQNADILKLTANDRFVLSSSAHRESANAYVTSADKFFYAPASHTTSKPAMPTFRRNSNSHAACLADAAAVVTASDTGTHSSTRVLSHRLFVPKLRTPPQVPNAGRGLAPVGSVPQGTVIHVENPMLCCPALKHVAKVWPCTLTFWAALA